MLLNRSAPLKREPLLTEQRITVQCDTVQGDITTNESSYPWIWCIDEFIRTEQLLPSLPNIVIESDFNNHVFPCDKIPLVSDWGFHVFLRSFDC